jgi:iron(III) transport system substrate-binding protein
MSRIATSLLSAFALMVCGVAAARAETLTVYSARNEQLIKPVFDRYTEQTGVAIKFATGEAGVLIQRLAAEGTASPADLLMTVDAGELWHAADLGLLQPVVAETLERNIPASLRDPGHRWFGLSQRARTIAYSTARLDPSKLSTYEALADASWKGRLCLRTSKKVYNQSLVAMMISEHGEERTEQVVRGWVANLATDPFANDTQLLEAIAAGQCDVGIVNSYYYGRIVKERPDFPVKLFWANQKAGGVHVNIAGAGITSGTKQKAAAIRFLEWLSGPDAQAQFAGLNMEFPVNPAAAIDPIVVGWGGFEASPINVAEAGRLQPAAVKLMDRAGYH